MPRIRPPRQGLSLLTASTQSHYVCRACRLQATRQFHLTSSTPVEIPFWKRIKDTFIGAPENDEKDAKRQNEISVANQDHARADAERARLETKLDRQGNEYEIAAFVDEKVNAEYIPAETWDGLETVGSEEWVKARADEGFAYTGFVPQRRLQLRNVAWQQLLETLWARATETQAAAALAPVDMAAITKQRGRNVNPEALARMMTRPVSDPAVKLSIVRDVLHLTGKRIPDPIISDAKTLFDLFETLSKKEKPKKLAHAPQLRKLNIEVPNVTVWDSRRTPIHKDKEVGRWKVIEEELKARNLPVTGSRWVEGKAAVR